MALSWAIKRSDKVFYSAWVGGFLYRLAFLGATVAFLWYNARVFMMPVLLPMIFVQLALQLWPLTTATKGTKAIAATKATTETTGTKGTKGTTALFAFVAERLWS